MKTKYTAKITADIKADINVVWDALTNPEIIRQYFFGTEVISDWKTGSPLIFKGTWENTTYEDHGIILELKKNELLRYNYWSSFSGKEDIPENYSNISYRLIQNNGAVTLTVTQDSIDSEQARDHSQQNWKLVLDNLKNLIEK